MVLKIRGNFPLVPNIMTGIVDNDWGNNLFMCYRFCTQFKWLGPIGFREMCHIINVISYKFLRCSIAHYLFLKCVAKFVSSKPEARDSQMANTAR